MPATDRPAGDRALAGPTVAALRGRGWALAPSYLSASEVTALAAEADALAAAAQAQTGGAPPGCLAFLDRFDSGAVRLARLERVAEALPTLAAGLWRRMQADAARCFGGPVVPFKDKLNLRYPGSAGYAPHRDAARWDRFAGRFLSFGLFLSPSDAARGGFEIARTAPPDLPLPEHRGDLIFADYARLPREELRAAPGDALLIDGDVPHRTTDNRSGDTILHLLVTFAQTDDPGVREAYYAGQRRDFAGAQAGGDRFVFRARPGSAAT